MENSILKEIVPYSFTNLGYLQTKLPPEALKFLNDAIKNKQKTKNPDLAGNIGMSHNIPDKNNWFFENILKTCMSHYTHHFGNCAHKTLTRDCKYVLDEMWVNHQQKHQFNPFHDHAGVFSFVIWCKIPYSGKEEKRLPFVKHSNSPSAGCFEFFYINTLGRIQNHQMSLSPKQEGTMLFFPATLTHQVYPFYTSNKDRISISGNIALEPEQIIKSV